MKKVIVTADDLGIDKNINRGIIDTFKHGILTSTALLMNAPETEEGILLAKSNPDLEVGLHLSIVEGKALSGEKSSVTDDLNYFSNEICLIRDWKHFTRKFVTGRINLNHLKRELELQIQLFLEHFQSIPFLNGTQHIHILPGVWNVVRALCEKYKVRAVRIPSFERPSVLWLNKRFPYMIPFQLFGSWARYSLKQSGVTYPDKVIGMQYSGHISEEVFLRILRNIPPGVSEIVMHPGYESKSLRENLPWAYKSFDWDMERRTLCSPRVREAISALNLHLSTFS